jgi:hypothetical protein
LDFAAAFMAVIGLLVVVSGLNRRPTPHERLAPYQPSVADEAELWLKSQE